MKRISAGLTKHPKYLTVPRGAHKKDESLPLNYVIRDMLKLADNNREVKKILREGNIIVNGKIRKDEKFGIGINDVISIPKIRKYYRVLPSTVPSRRFELCEISEEEAKFKLAKVIRKQMVKGAKLQIGTEGGYTFLFDKVDDGKNINTKDTLVLDISTPKARIEKILKFKEGAFALITKGRNKGMYGKIVSITKGDRNIPSLTKVGNIETLTEYVTVIGEETPLIKIEQSQTKSD